MNQLRVLLVQLPVPNNPATNTPLAAGYLKAYAYAQGLLEHVAIDILPRAIADHAGDALLVAEIVARAPDVLGFSLYTWNSERSLDVARRVKARLPGVLVVVGGPEVQRDNDWVLCHPGVDVAVLGEGEQTFAELLSGLRFAGLRTEARRTPPSPPPAALRPMARRPLLSPALSGLRFASLRTEARRTPLRPPPAALRPMARRPLLSPALSGLRFAGLRTEARRTPLRPPPAALRPMARRPLLSPAPSVLSTIPGIAFRDASGALHVTPERVALNDLSVVPSPYLLGYLDGEPDGMLMVEVSRWCPYSCSFCLYGRNMGPKLGSRYFPLEQILAEIRWGRARGLRQVHFIEANLNLVPIFRPLMAALADLNADGQMALYAELRGEHLSEEAVRALVAAGLRVAEVGLQTANTAALKAALRRTDLAKWAAGTRRLYAQGVEVLLDVILGLPEDDADGVAETLDFIEREALGPYDVFTLQVLPGTAVRQQVAARGYVHQDRPPYYVLHSDRLDYAGLRQLRRALKLGAGLEPDALEGCPEPRLDIKDWRLAIEQVKTPLTYVCLLHPEHQAQQQDVISSQYLANHVDVLTRWEQLQSPVSNLPSLMISNPATLFDVYLLCDDAPPPADDLRRWRDALPYQPGYLDRVAVYRRAAPEPAHARVSPRLWLVVPWTSALDPNAYTGVAEVIWEYDLAPGEEPPLGAWRAAGGAGVRVRGAAAGAVARWRAASGLRLWG